MSGRIERAAMGEASRARQAQRSKAHGNYAKKTDNEAAKTKKANAQSKENTKAKGRSLAKNINSAFQKAKADTTRTGNYSQMSRAEIAKDIAQDAAGKVYNGAVEVARQGAKGVYKAGKKVANAGLDLKNTVEDAAADVKAYAKRKLDGAKTRAANFADRVGTKVSQARNWFSHAAKNISRLGD